MMIYDDDDDAEIASFERLALLLYNIITIMKHEMKKCENISTRCVRAFSSSKTLENYGTYHILYGIKTKTTSHFTFTVILYRYGIV
jgi:hypothetical protein